MFIGHFGLGMGAKAVEPKLSLGMLFLASQFIDLIWPTFLILGLEHVEINPGITNVAPLDFVDYPFSHSLLTVVGWGLLMGTFYFLLKKNKKGAFLLASLVVSHWFLDLVVHRPDLPLAPGLSTKVGLGLWYSWTATFFLESLLFIAGVGIYLKKTVAKNRVGKWATWGLFVFLVFIHLGNFFGPPPTQVSDVAWAGQLQWLLVIWAFWADKNRTVAISNNKKDPNTMIIPA